MKTTIRWDDESGRFQIVQISDDETAVCAVIETLPEGTTNEQACAYYDEWRVRNGS